MNLRIYYYLVYPNINFPETNLLIMIFDEKILTNCNHYIKIIGLKLFIFILFRVLNCE